MDRSGQVKRKIDAHHHWLNKSLNPLWPFHYIPPYTGNRKFLSTPPNRVPTISEEKMLDMLKTIGPFSQEADLIGITGQWFETHRSLSQASKRRFLECLPYMNPHYHPLITHFVSPTPRLIRSLPEPLRDLVEGSLKLDEEKSIEYDMFVLFHEFLDLPTDKLKPRKVYNILSTLQKQDKWPVHVISDNERQAVISKALDFVRIHGLSRVTGSGGLSRLKNLPPEIGRGRNS